MTVYLVMRTKGLRSDGYYYDSETTIIGSREKPEDASVLLHTAASIVHKNEKPSRGAYDKHGDTELVFDIEHDMLEDRFWIEIVNVGEFWDKIQDLIMEANKKDREGDALGYQS